MDRIEDAKPDWMRRGWVPQPVGRGNQASYDGCRVLNFGAVGAFTPTTYPICLNQDAQD